MEVYKFAHEMQITSLMHAVNEFFKTINTTEALAVYLFCIQMDNEQGLQNCHEVICKFLHKWGMIFFAVLVVCLRVFCGRNSSSL
jgi:hypothetical protein